LCGAGLGGNAALTVHQNASCLETGKTLENAVGQKKKFKKQYKKMTKRKKFGLYVFLPLFVISFLLLAGLGVGVETFAVFAFLSLACLLAFIFSMLKQEDAAIRVGNTLLIIAASINLIVSWYHAQFRGY
jgi:GPR1/FUN34/yaaH family